MESSLVIFFFGLFCLTTSASKQNDLHHIETNSKLETPQWVDLECQAGHKYLFVTDEVRNWVDARDHCQLFGGWLVDIQDVHEQNCLMRHAYKTDGLTDYNYWTDASDLEDGVWMHTSTNSEVTWFGTKGISCVPDGVWKPMGGHAIHVSFYKNRAELNGQFCDRDMTIETHYICKALI